MIKVNVSGTVVSVVTMYELMKARGYGKIVRLFFMWCEGKRGLT